MTEIDDAALDALIEDLGSPFALASAAPSPAEAARALRRLRAENAELRARLADEDQKAWDRFAAAALRTQRRPAGLIDGRRAYVELTAAKVAIEARNVADAMMAERDKWIAGKTD